MDQSSMTNGNSGTSSQEEQDDAAQSIDGNSSSVFQLLKSIDERLKSQAETLATSARQFRSLTDTVEECKNRLVDLENICAPLRDDIRLTSGPVRRRADQSVQVSGNKSMTSLLPILPRIPSLISPIRSVSKVVPVPLTPEGPSSQATILSNLTDLPDDASAHTCSTLACSSSDLMSSQSSERSMSLTLASNSNPEKTPHKVQSPRRGGIRKSLGISSPVSFVPDSDTGSQERGSLGITVEFVPNSDDEEDMLDVTLKEEVLSSENKNKPRSSPKSSGREVGLANKNEKELEARRKILGDSSSDSSLTSSDLDDDNIKDVVNKPSPTKSSTPSTVGKSSTKTKSPNKQEQDDIGSSDSDDELDLKNLSRRMARKLEALKKGTASADATEEEYERSLEDLKNCQKLTMSVRVNIETLSKSVLLRIEQGGGTIQLTKAELRTAAAKVKSRNPTSLKKFNPIVGPKSRVRGGQIIAGSKRMESEVKDQETENVLFSGSDSDGEDTRQSFRAHVGTLLNSVSVDKEGDNESDSENELLMPGTSSGDSDEDRARRVLLASDNAKGNKSKEAKVAAESSKASSKAGKNFTPRLIGFSSSEDEEVDGNKLKKKSKAKGEENKKLRKSKKDMKSRNDSSDSDTESKKPKPIYLQNIIAEKTKKRKKGAKDDDESSDDSCLATTQKKKLAEKKVTTDDDSDFAVRISRRKRVSPVKKAASQKLKVESSDDSGDSSTLTPGNGKVKSDNSDDSDFMPSNKKKVLRNRLGSDSEDESGKKALPESESLDESSTSCDQRSSRRKKGKRIRSSSEDSKKKSSKTKRRRRIKAEPTSGSDSDVVTVREVDSDIEEVTNTSPAKGRKNIRKMIKDQNLDKTTRQAAKEEEERKRRVAEKQKLFNEAFVVNVDITDTLESLVLDFDKKTKEPLISVDPAIVRKLKPHQVKGVQFMWDTCFESVSNPLTGGCILAHCMGLGKTLQAIAFLHTIMANKAVKVRTALVICPLSTVGNWYKEFRMWCKECDVQPKVHKLYDAKSPQGRIHALEDWKRMGGVGIIHYDAFRALANSDVKKKGKPSKKNLNIIREALLDPGPDLVICDEGHLLKNPSSQQSKAVMKLSTRRRIVLTGTPLQNNLGEYHTMMSFVKPNLLGTLKEFRNRFVNPIANGQHKDSDEYDVKVMKKRAHVLHKLLDGCVQRLDYSVLTPYLPPKFEYAITINLSEKQHKLYAYYINNLSGNPEGVEKFVAHKLFSDYQALVKIWTHPVVLTFKNQQKEAETDSETGSLKDFIADSTEDEEDSSVVQTSDSDDDVKEIDPLADSPKPKRGGKSTRANPLKDDDDDIVEVPNENDLGPNWYASFFESRKDMERMELSGKLVVLFEIIKTCEAIGDKILVFSQFLTSLDLIEEFLEEWDARERKKNASREVTFPPTNSDSIGRWRPNIEYFRIDGSTKTDDRQKHCDTFNHRLASKAKLFLISTRAGGLGINLTGANRVVIFDASWNPSHDLQSIFRVYRFGQHKPCYVYRLLARGTMEEKIYNRQVVKLSLSCRVVDEQQIERHFQFDEIRDMYKFNYDEKAEPPTPIVPKDRLLADLLISQKDWVFSYLEHDSLLENKEEEELTEEERKAAWDEYNNEGKRNPIPNGLTGQDPWITSTMPKLKLVHPSKTLPELYQICLQSKNDYQLLQALFNQHADPATDPILRQGCQIRIQETVKRLKAAFGDTVNWNEHFTQKAQQDAKVRALHQAQQQIVNRRARMPATGAGAMAAYQNFVQTSNPNQYVGPRAGQVWDANIQAQSQILLNQLQSRGVIPQNQASGSRAAGTSFSPTMQVAQATATATGRAPQTRAMPGIGRIQTRTTEYQQPPAPAEK